MVLELFGRKVCYIRTKVNVIKKLLCYERQEEKEYQSVGGYRRSNINYIIIGVANDSRLLWRHRCSRHGGTADLTRTTELIKTGIPKHTH